MKIITYVCEPNILQETCHGSSPLSAGSPPTILPPPCWPELVAFTRVFLIVVGLAVVVVSREGGGNWKGKQQRELWMKTMISFMLMITIALDYNISDISVTARRFLDCGPWLTQGEIFHHLCFAAGEVQNIYSENINGVFFISIFSNLNRQIRQVEV